MPLRILILDDDRATTRVVAVVLAALGYEPVECHCPQGAVAKLRAEAFALLVTDYHMPSMTGLDVVQEIQNDGCTINTILMSGDFAAVDLQVAERMGVFALLPKPFGISDLKDVLSLVLQTAQAPRQDKTQGIEARDEEKADQLNGAALLLRKITNNVLASA